jgi:hypothetical protein
LGREESEVEDLSFVSTGRARWLLWLRDHALSFK